jgi:hypothetical protein
LCGPEEIDVPPLVVATSARGSRSGVDAISSFTTLGVVHGYVWDGAGYMLSEPELIVAFQWDGNSVLDAMHIALADRARDGWRAVTSTSLESALSTGWTFHQRAAFTYMPFSLFATSWDLTATALPNGQVNCTFAHEILLGAPGWEFGNMCYDYPRGIWSGGL